MGIECNAPIRFELRDDRVETYIRALREHINPNVSSEPVVTKPSLPLQFNLVVVEIWLVL